MSLTDIVGQTAATARLLHARQRERLAHGYLFCGEEGTGRERTARSLAQALLCEAPCDGDACGVCGACLRVSGGSHPDLQIVMPEAEAVRRGLTKPESGRSPSPEIRLDAVRELSRRLRMHSYEGSGRVGIVVDAHRLRIEAANALLKTLEEPAAGTLLVLIAPGPRAVLDTLRSRCQIVRFAPLTEEAIVRQLVENEGVAEEEARSAAGRADGSLTRALRICGEDVAERTQRCQRFLRVSAAGRSGDVLDAVLEIGRDRQVAREHLSELARLLRDRVNVAGRAGHRAEVSALGRAFAAVLDADDAVRRNALPQLTLEALAIQLQPLLTLVPGTDARAGEESP